jgi:ankyrin repeat protein
LFFTPFFSECSHINIRCALLPYREPTSAQVTNYDNDLINAVRNSDLAGLTGQLSSGKRMDACNKYSESVLHIACRRASVEVVEYLLRHGADLEATDDYGRTPAHDACWRTEPYFELISLILDRNSELLRFVDNRGHTPLEYVREEHWPAWREFFRCNHVKYWSPRDVHEESAAK